MSAMFVGWLEWDGKKVVCRYTDRAYMSLAKARTVLNKVKATRGDALLSAWVERRNETGEKSGVPLHEVYMKIEDKRVNVQ
jgi:hypothetical protein